MNNWKNFLLAQTLVIVCAALPQFTGVHLSAHITSLGVMFMLTWRILSQAPERDLTPTPAPKRSESSEEKKETNNE